MALFAGALMAGAYGLSYRDMHAADRFVHDIMDIEPEARSSDVIQVLLREYRQYVVPGVHGRYDSLSFEFNNRPMAMLHISRLTSVGAAITFRDGHTSTISIVYDFQSEYKNAIAVDKLLTHSSSRKQVDTAGQFGRTSTMIFVVLDAPSAEQQAKVISSLNLECLIKIGGCSSVRELAPSLYDDAYAKEH